MKDKYFDIMFDNQLVKQTLMACAFPALIKQRYEDDFVCFEGFLPGFKDAVVNQVESEDECVEYLQDMLDDEVEQLIEDGKTLPDVKSDEDLMKEYPGYKIVYLDINVYADADCECDNNCESCGNDCILGDYDCNDDCHCGEDCHCNEHSRCNDNCNCNK